MWARVVDDRRRRADGRLLRSHQPAPQLRVLGIFGLRPEREGFSAVETAGPRPVALERPDGTPLFSPVLAGGQAAGLYSLVGGEELLELGWRTRALANSLSAHRADDRRRPQLHGQEGGRAGARADRRLSRAQGRESVPHPCLPHGRARGRQLPGRPARGPGGRQPGRDEGRRARHAPDRRPRS